MSNGEGVVIFLKEFPEFGKFRKVEVKGAVCDGCIFATDNKCINPYFYKDIMDCWPYSGRNYIFERVE